MRVLVVKLTSMGDVLHVMPALTDLHQHVGDLKVDWMVEDSFAQIPAWHPTVDRVIPVATRRWRGISRRNAREFRDFLRQLRDRRYDAVIDAQGLIKSAIFGRFAKLASDANRYGFSADSIKESPAARFYSKTLKVSRDLHAIDRVRALFAGAFDYAFEPEKVDYGLIRERNNVPESNNIFLLHGTTWATKHAPESLWRDLVNVINEDGFRVTLCWGNEPEKQRAERLASGSSEVEILPRSSLTELKAHLGKASGAIAVDTGLGHLTAALGVPCVSLYGSTDSALTGTVGDHQLWLQSDYPCSPCLLKQCPKLTEQIAEPPCYQEFTADNIWRQLQVAMAARPK